MTEFTKIEGDIKLLTSEGGSVSVHVEGVRVPEGSKAIGDYFGAQVAKALGGITDGQVDGMKNQVAKLEQSLATKAAELESLQSELAQFKKAANAKRNTPQG